MTSSTNPLAKHFRQPQLFTKLISDARWYPEDAIEKPVTGEYPVYAMTAKDELTLKTPDALLNGQATVDVIQSCMPNIKDAWKIPSVDVDSILIAIRRATYGNEMEFIGVCPHCQEKNEFNADLEYLAGLITCPDYSKTIKVGGLEIYFKPQNYYEFNKTSIENFEQQRMLNLVNNQDMDPAEKTARFRSMFNSLLDLTVNQVAANVAGIKTEDNILVEDRQQLDEFFKNCNKDVWNAIKEHVEFLASNNPLQQIPVTCDQEECGKEYVTPLIFEMSNFFG